MIEIICPHCETPLVIDLSPAPSDTEKDVIDYICEQAWTKVLLKE